MLKHTASNINAYSFSALERVVICICLGSCDCFYKFQAAVFVQSFISQPGTCLLKQNHSISRNNNIEMVWFFLPFVLQVIFSMDSEEYEHVRVLVYMISLSFHMGHSVTQTCPTSASAKVKSFSGEQQLDLVAFTWKQHRRLTRYLNIGLNVATNLQVQRRWKQRGTCTKQKSPQRAIQAAAQRHLNSSHFC